MAEGGMLRRKSARVIAEPMLAVNSGCSRFLPGRANSVIALLQRNMMNKFRLTGSIRLC
jgi:hypothetical protein